MSVSFSLTFLKKAPTKTNKQISQQKSKMKPTNRLIKQALNGEGGGGAHPNFLFDPNNPTNTKKYREDIDRITQDLNLLNQKIADVRGDSLASNLSFSVPTPSSDSHSSKKGSGSGSGSGGHNETAISPFVTGIRSIAESERSRLGDIKDQKITVLESLLEKLGEYDRLILARTVPPPAENNNNNITNNNGNGNSAQPQRRKSFGTDLNLLPTHLRVIDRLLDLYNSSKRVTVLRQTITPPTGASTTNQQQQHDTHHTPTPMAPQVQPPPKGPDPATQRMIDELKVNAQKLTQKLELSETRRIEAENQYEFKSKDYESLQKKYDQLQQLHTKQDEEFQQQKANQQQFQDLFKQFEKESFGLQEKLEIEISHNQRLLNALMNKIQAIQQDNQSVLSEDHQMQNNPSAEYQGMPEKYQMILQALDGAISQRFANYKSEVQLVLSLKDMIETEMSTMTVQKDLLAKDFHTLQEEHGALKAAYHSLSYESATIASNKQEKAENAKLQKEIHSLQELITQQTDAITRLEREKQIQSLSENATKQYEQYNKELEQKLAQLRQEKDSLKFEYNNALLEVQQYKALTEKLKQKLKETSNQSNKNNDFLDTFEEVMKEEMMTMKMAFEAKLKMAREETDALQKKHQQEILRMQASASPLNALKR